MSRTIAINGIKLHEVRMPLEPHTKGVVSSLSYPENQLHCSADEEALTLVVPAYLAVELYRIAILPQQSNLPVLVQVGRRAEAWFVVKDVRYPSQNDGPFGRVTFKLTRVRQGAVRDMAREPAPVQPRPKGTYVTDITHYLDENGELMLLPGPARKLASFLTLLIEASTSAPSNQFQDSCIRCRTKACTGTILTMLLPGQDEINWHCPECGHNGVIRNWKNTKWNQLKGK